MSQMKTVVGCLALLALGAFVVGAAASGCGSTASQADARDRATSTSCSWFQMCGKIGAGQTYDTLDSCEVQVRGQWDKAWPVSQCDGKISEADLEVCLEAIASTTCDNGLDELNTLVNKCPAAKICAGAMTTPDGG